MTASYVELRCPADPRRLFAKLLQSGDRPRIVEGNLIEFSCKNCRKQRGDVVFHRFNILGELIETVAAGETSPTGADPKDMSPTRSVVRQRS